MKKPYRHRTPLFKFVGKSLVCFLLSVFISLSQAKAENTDTIVWQYPNFPPTHIVEGPYQGEDLLTPIYRLVFRHLSDYKHEKSLANFQRVIRAIADKRNVCAVALLRNEERDEMVEYSVVHFYVHPVRIIIRRNSIDAFAPYKQKDGTYSLENIMRDSKLILGYSHGRSYGEALDAILKNRINDTNSVLSSQTSILKGLLHMLARERFDFTLGYAHETTYVADVTNLDDMFVSLAISGANDFIPVYVGCPKNEWGRGILKKLNPFLKKVRATKSYYGGYLRWLDPEARRSYPGFIQQVFLKMQSSGS